MDAIPSENAAARGPQLGLAIASLVLGIIAVALSFLVVGFFLGVVGIALGAAHLSRKTGPVKMARWGVVLSVIGLVASIGFGAFYMRAYQKFTKAMMAAGNENQSDLVKWEGVAAPEISVKALDGQTIKLSDLKGKRVVLDFWATWCGPCVQEIPNFKQLFTNTSRDDLVIVGISDEDAATLKKFAQEKSVNYPIVSAKKMPVPYSDIQAIPTTFFIDRKGVIQKIAVGYHDLDDLTAQALGTDYPGAAKPAP